MENTVDCLARGIDPSDVPQISLNRLDAERFQFRIPTAREDPHGIAARDELLDNVATQKAAAPGDKRLHQ